MTLTVSAWCLGENYSQSMLAEHTDEGSVFWNLRCILGLAASPDDQVEYYYVCWYYDKHGAGTLVPRLAWLLANVAKM